MLPGFELSDFAATAGPVAAILVVALILFAESGLLFGFFLPGDSILFTVGFLIYQDTHLHFNLFLALIIFFVAAALGDSTGYLFGKKVGPRLFNRPNSVLFKRQNVEKAQEFYEKYGGKTIILGRFVPVIRTFVPIVAGIGKMPYKTFLIFNLIGALLWSSGVTLLGFFLGSLFTKLGIDIDTVLLPIIALILFLSVLPVVYHALKQKSQRDALKATIRSFFRKK